MQNDVITPMVKEAYVLDVTLSNSAFATTADNESVFINSRIMDALKIQPGDRVKAYVVANYSDKQDRVPWRAVRCEVIGTVFEGVEKEAPPPPPAPQKDLSARILAALEEHGPLRTSTLGRLLGTNSGEIGSLCLGLFAEGKVALADVFSEPAQKRASHRVWAVNLNEFDVDPFEDSEE
jgi:hypothetical protein